MIGAKSDGSILINIIALYALVATPLIGGVDDTRINSLLVVTSISFISTRLYKSNEAMVLEASIVPVEFEQIDSNKPILDSLES